MINGSSLLLANYFEWTMWGGGVDACRRDAVPAHVNKDSGGHNDLNRN
jgi:hypothetical protein